MVRGVLGDLIPGSTYEVSVAGVNGAVRRGGLGIMSTSAQTNTLNGELLYTISF